MSFVPPAVPIPPELQSLRAKFHKLTFGDPRLIAIKNELALWRKRACHVCRGDGEHNKRACEACQGSRQEWYRFHPKRIDS